MENNYFALVADITKEPYDAVKKKMVSLYENYNVEYKDYYEKKFYELSEVQLKRRINIYKRAQDRRRESYEKIMRATSSTKEAVIEDIIRFNTEYNLKLSQITYARFEVYNYKGDELEKFVKTFKRRNFLRKKILKKFREADNGKIESPNVQALLKQYYEIVDEILPENERNILREKLIISMPHLKTNDELCKKVIIDLEATRSLLNFSVAEYVSFRLYGRSMYEKSKFITDRKRLKVIEQVNCDSKIDILDDKYQSYEAFKEFYKREMIQIKSLNDYDAFLDVCSRHDIVVIKPTSDSMGRGIRPIDVSNKDDLKVFFQELLDENGEFILEELIVPHRRIRKLNPDSVNTIRLVTYNDGEKILIHRPFMKVGKKGSFVDNGGAGGILVSVDLGTGRLNTDGCDEEGVRYKRHPNTGVKFKGYKLPHWTEAIKLAKSVATTIPEIPLIGWDMTYTRDNGWIIVEANSRTQMFAQQCTTGVGIRDEVFELVGYKEKKLDKQ